MKRRGIHSPSNPNHPAFLPSPLLGSKGEGVGGEIYPAVIAAASSRMSWKARVLR